MPSCPKHLRNVAQKPRSHLLSCMIDAILAGSLLSCRWRIGMVSWANESQRVAYQLPAEAVIAALHSDADSGLSGSEALARLARDGPNALEAEPPTPVWRRFLAQFQDTLVLLLLIATAI